MKKRLKVFTWHIHGSYLYYLSKANIEIYIPVDPAAGDGFGGKGTIPFGDNVHELPAREVRNAEFDCILFQSPKNYEMDQYNLFSEEQLRLPKLYLEHDPPRGTPTDTQHVVKDKDVTVVHVTHFNQLMWDNHGVPVIVIDHGVVDPGELYSGELNRGIVVINNIAKRGRRLGLDIFLEAREHIPLDLVGMGAKELGGIGEVPLNDLPAFIARYRFFFNPIRYTSLGLAVCEAMMTGVPVIGMATTEMVTVIKNDVSGYTHTDPRRVILAMQRLLHEPDTARKWGLAGRAAALERFNINRFAADWETLLMQKVSAANAGKATLIQT